MAAWVSKHRTVHLLIALLIFGAVIGQAAGRSQDDQIPVLLSSRDGSPMGSLALALWLERLGYQVTRNDDPGHRLEDTGVLLLLAVLGQNTADSMHRMGLTPGFAFLSHQANFEIGESVLSYSAGDSYARALAAGITNTVKVAIVGCLLATVLGVALGIARLSGNLLLASFVHGYVELLRNTPLLLQLFLWSAIIHALPPPRGAYTFLGSVYLSNRGIYLPSLSIEGVPTIVWLSTVVLAVLAAVLLCRRLFARSAFYLPKSAGAALAALRFGFETLRFPNVIGPRSGRDEATEPDQQAVFPKHDRGLRT